LKSLSNREIQGYKENARAFLASPRFQQHTKEAFAEHFFRIVEEDAGISINRGEDQLRSPASVGRA
jgi:hypothetical protein